MYGFKQIKEFNIDTVTQEVASELCAIAGLWNTYLWGDYNDRFIIENQYKSGSVNGKDVTGEPDGVRITHKDTRHLFRIWCDGRIACDSIIDKDDEWEYLARYKPDGKEQVKRRKPELPCCQLTYAAKLCELGFYKFDLREEKLKRLLKN